MNRTLTITTLGLALCAAISSVSAQTATASKALVTPEPAAEKPSAAQIAMQRAADDHKFVFLFLFRVEDDSTKAMRQALDTAMTQFTDRATSVAVNITDVQEKSLVSKYGLDRAPMPLLLAVAPNGAVTRSFPLKFTETELKDAFVSPGMQKCLKALQDRKMVFVCVQNKTTSQNDGAMKGVNEFVADKEFAGTEVVIIDPADEKELRLLKQFRVDPKTEFAESVLLAPPGTVVGNFVGKMSKDTLVAAVRTAAKGCDPKSGCCSPKKKS